MNTSLEINLQSIIADAILLERHFLKGRACYHTGEIVAKNGFKSAGAGFAFSFSRPINIPISDTVDDVKTALLNIEVGLPTPNNGFEYAIRINFPVAFQLDEDCRGKCGILDLVSSHVSFAPYIRFVAIRHNEVDDDYEDESLDVEGELIKSDSAVIPVTINKRGMSFNPRILEEITIAIKEDEVNWTKLREATREQA